MLPGDRWERRNEERVKDSRGGLASSLADRHGREVGSGPAPYLQFQSAVLTAAATLGRGRGGGLIESGKVPADTVSGGVGGVGGRRWDGMEGWMDVDLPTSSHRLFLGAGCPPPPQSMALGSVCRPPAWPGVSVLGLTQRGHMCFLAACRC